MNGGYEARLLNVLRDLDPLVIAVSGGVDSLTLATFAHRHTAVPIRVFHAVSPAVPDEATCRVRAMALQESWALTIIDAREFVDERYRANPVNRCYFCKSNLYSAIAARTSWQIVAGTNVDDLQDYRPGLQAAQEHSVRHPYVEAGLDKRAVRSLARSLGMPDIAELPASPCLSSRIETGISIDAAMLRLVHQVEQFVAARIQPRTVRCRIRLAGLVIELDDESLARLGPREKAEIRSHIVSMARQVHCFHKVVFGSYRMGSAVVQARVAVSPT